MNRPLLATLLRKDFRLFWPFAALLAGMIVVAQFPALVLMMGPFGPLLRVVISLGTIVMILVVFQEDAVVSLKHDWLTRPIPGSTQLKAKLIFVLAVVILPALLGGIVNSLLAERSIGESLQAGLGAGTSSGTLSLVAIVMCVAAVTGNVRQAIIAALAGFAFFAVLAMVIQRMSTENVPLEYSGSLWVLGSSMQLILLVTAISVLVVQYRHRHSRMARVIVGVALLLGCGLVAMTSWSRVFAVQKALSPEPAAAADVRALFEQACFPTRVLDAAEAGNLSGRAAEIRPNVFAEEQRDRAGADAIAFSTRLAMQGVPPDNLIRIGGVIMKWRADGHELHRVFPGQSRPRWVRDEVGRPTVDYYWLLKRDEYQRLASQAGVETQVDFSMTLLAPNATAEFAADGQRAWRPGIGYCSATFDRANGSVVVDCFKWGAQPALLTAKVSGRPDTELGVPGPPNYTPAVIDFWGGRQHNVQLASQGPETPRVIVTAYRARAHFDRQLIVPGVLGGPVSACPAP